MKWRLITLLAALFMLIPAFTSCDTKEKDEPKDPNGDEEQTIDISKITGTYNGTLGAVVMTTDCGNLPGDYDLKIEKTKSDDSTVTVTLPECSFTPPIPQASTFTIPLLTIDSVDVTEKDNVYTVSDDDFSIDVNGTTYTGKLSGTITGKDIKVEYTVRPGRMPMDINFTFIGTLK